MNTLDQKTCLPYRTDWINRSLPANDNFLDDQEWILADILSVKGLQSLLDSYINGRPKYLKVDSLQQILVETRFELFVSAGTPPKKISLLMQLTCKPDIALKSSKILLTI
jgi:hypothetical protein